MPHIIVKLWPGDSDDQKNKLAEKITESVKDVLGLDQQFVSVSFEEVLPAEWVEKVYKPDIEDKPDQLYKKPGYKPSDL